MTGTFKSQEGPTPREGRVTKCRQGRSMYLGLAEPGGGASKGLDPTYPRSGIPKPRRLRVWKYPQLKGKSCLLLKLNPAASCWANSNSAWAIQRVAGSLCIAGVRCGSLSWGCSSAVSFGVQAIAALSNWICGKADTFV